MASYDLPTPGPNQAFVTVSALNGGYLTAPERMFVTDADPEKSKTVPSLCFLICHESQGVKKRIVFDLGLKRNLPEYAEGMKVHMSKREPIITDPDASKSLRLGGLDPATDIHTVIPSHCHWDHIGTPQDYASANFVVGSGTLSMFKTGVKYYAANMFEKDPLPVDRTFELPPTKDAKELDVAAEKQTEHVWKPLANFPNAIDYFSDGSMFIIDSPGHLRGHVNLLLRVAADRWVYLGGDCCHDPRIITGEKGIATYDDGLGGKRSVHSDHEGAKETIDRIQKFVQAHPRDVEWIVAHDLEWAQANKHRFFPGTL